MGLTPFSQKYPDDFLSRREDNTEVLIGKLKLFLDSTRQDIGDGKNSRRSFEERFSYAEELKQVKISETGISSEEVAKEFNDLLKGTLRHQDPTASFNLIPAPLLDTLAGITLMSLYNPNTCWDFISGKLCLYEKKIVRMLGQLVNWTEADGFVVTGGKQALAYAIKNGMARASQNEQTDLNDFVVICSSLAHYSIEHTCHYLGIKSSNCLRVASHPTGEIDLQALKKTMGAAISNGKKIAAIISVGGGTINLVPDPTLEIKQCIHQIKEEFSLNYTPYLHVDTVISWAWLAFCEQDLEEMKSSKHPRVLQKIESVISKLKGIEYADSFAADFHKTGFCPYAAGVFIAKNSNCLIGMSIDGSSPKEELLFGEAEIFRQTLENSRPGLAIASIWISLRKMGLQGLRDFILYQLEVCETFKSQIRTNYSDCFEVLNEHSNGWEIVLKPHFFDKISWKELQIAPEEKKNSYIQFCHEFLGKLWFSALGAEQHKTPVIGFVKKYSQKGAHEQSFPAFLIHPCSLHYDESAIEELLQGILQSKRSFEEAYASLQTTSTDNYLLQFVPPR